MYSRNKNELLGQGFQTLSRDEQAKRQTEARKIKIKITHGVTCDIMLFVVEGLSLHRDRDSNER